MSKTAIFAGIGAVIGFMFAGVLGAAAGGAGGAIVSKKF